MKNLFHLFNSDMSIGESILYSVLGMAIVFLMLAVLMYIIKLVGFIMKRMEEKERLSTGSETAGEEAIPAPPDKGDLLILNGVPARTAAIVMALVADSLKKPINELRFKSIREDR